MTSENNYKELDALIRLIDDPDVLVYERIRDRIFEFGNEAIPILEKAWENTFDEFVKERLQDIIHEINLREIKNHLGAWVASGGEDLLDGALQISKLRYPGLDIAAITREMGNIAQDIWLEMSDRMSPLDKIRVINHIIFDVYGFSTLRPNQQNLSNVMLHHTLQLKKGGPTSLGLLYLSLAQSLKLPVYGVDIPMNFALAYLEADPGKYLTKPENDPVLFYINPYFKGLVFTRREIDRFLKGNKIEPDKYYYQPCSNITVISRYAEGIQHLMEMENLYPEAEELAEIVKLLTPKNDDII